jgi:hypothetical protein
VRIFALLFGIVFLFLGVTGYIPGVFTEWQLGNFFKVNLWLNLLHTLTGVAACIVGLISRRVCRIYFQIIGSLYALMAVLGFVYRDKEILGLFASNQFDTWFHVVTAIAALVLGYGGAES